MIKSMTGYGSSEITLQGRRYSIEARSVNHRFIDISMRLSEGFLKYEQKIREMIKRRFSRGYFTVYVHSTSDTAKSLDINIPLARNYLDAIKRLKEELNIDGSIDLSLMLMFREIFLRGELEYGENNWEELKEGIDTALSKLTDMRKAEGKNLSHDISSGLVALGGYVAKIREREPSVIDFYRERLKRRIESFSDIQIEEQRLLAEVAIFAERSNITEELTRLDSHIEQFNKTMELNEPNGRRLDFLCQEMLREINTIASKANDVDISHMVVEMKWELEQIREQVQNIE
ncbi:MAG: YicC/YloC family endoribonuclease [Thermodesulfobacteriota bacterium]